MITLDAKSKKAASSSLLLLLQKNEKNKTQFSDLLKNVDVSTIQKDGKNESKNSRISQNSQHIIENLKNTLKDEANPQNDNEMLELNEHLTATLNNKELKELIQNAKTYLKDKILYSDGYKQSQIKELPNTLEGLLKVAKLLDIDVSKITLQEVQEFSTATEKTSNQDRSLAQDVLRKSEQDSDSKVLEANDTHIVGQPQTIKNDISIIENMLKKEVIKEQKQVELKDFLSLKEPISEKIEQKQVELKDFSSIKEQKNEQVEQKQIVNIKELPIFKAQDTAGYTPTEHLMQSKLNSEQKTVPTQKDRADEVLRTLLQTSKANDDLNLGVEFSVDSAKVIAPKAKKDDDASLSDLLQNSSKNDDTFVSQDIGIVKSNNDLDVKINEAKQMVKYLSSDIKNAIDEYKSPFTRVKVQLNPQNLGEVDLTVVQRGNNLHINLSSNNAAINALAMNLNDLKIQLNNNGINNATFNFSSNSQDTQSSYSNQQQQSGQNHQRAATEYSYFDKEEQNEEILSSLEIVVPRYI